MLRTRESAQIIAEHIDCEPVVFDGLQEAMFGEWDGHTFAEVMDSWPAQMSGWLGSPQIAPPGGESVQQVFDRVSAAFDRVLAAYPGKRIVVAAHVGTIRSLTVRALGAPLGAINRLEIAPASLTTLSWYADGNSSLRSFAEAAHLDELQQTWVP
jgi:probable phosphoglycerate mutase